MKRLGKLAMGICEQSGTEIILNRADVYILCIKPDETKVTWCGGVCRWPFCESGEDNKLFRPWVVGCWYGNVPHTKDEGGFYFSPLLFGRGRVGVSRRRFKIPRSCQYPICWVTEEQLQQDWRMNLSWHFHHRHAIVGLGAVHETE